MIQDDNSLLLPVKTYQPLPSQQDTLDDIFQNARALHFYLTSTLRRCLRRLTPNWQNKHEFINYHFHCFQEGFLSQKSEQIVHFRQLRTLRKIHQSYLRRKEKQIKQKNIQEKMTSYKSKAIFQEWLKIMKVTQKEERLLKKRRQETFLQLLQLLREHQSSKAFRALQLNDQLLTIQGVYQQKLLRKAFEDLNINRKASKLMKFLLPKHFQIFLKHTIASNRQDKKITFDLERRSLLLRAFRGWKDIYQEKLADQFYQSKLLVCHFRHWKNILDVLVTEREEQQNNDCIVDIFLERSAQKKLKNAFIQWHQWVQQAQQTRHKNHILSLSAEMKRKQLLLSIHFQKLKANCINSKVNAKYYGAKLKRKALDSLKLYFQYAVQREEKIISFMETRSIKRCFQKIQQFNKDEGLKFRAFRLKQLLKAFTQSIISRYFQQRELALRFRQTHLLYKVLLGLKKEVTFHQREVYVIGLINAKIPLQRWQKHYQIRHFVTEKGWFFKKKLFRQWQLQTIKKGTQKKIFSQSRLSHTQHKKEDRLSESKMEQLQLQNIRTTIAKIRNNLETERLEVSDSAKQRSGFEVFKTPSRSFDFQYSLQNS